jgi:hypothetical protein
MKVSVVIPMHNGKKYLPQVGRLAQISVVGEDMSRVHAQSAISRIVWFSCSGCSES